GAIPSESVASRNAMDPFGPGVSAISHVTPVRFAISSESTWAGTRKGASPGATAMLMSLSGVCAAAHRETRSAAKILVHLNIKRHLSKIEHNPWRLQIGHTNACEISGAIAI